MLNRAIHIIIAGALLAHRINRGSICGETDPVLLLLLDLDSLLDGRSDPTRDRLLLIICWSRDTSILMVMVLLSGGWGGRRRIVLVGLPRR